jgi:hypothetical protein
VLASTKLKADAPMKVGICLGILRLPESGSED